MKMKTYHVIGAVLDGFDKRAHSVTLQFNGQEIAAQSIKLTSREVRLFGRKGIQLIIPG